MAKFKKVSENIWLPSEVAQSSEDARYWKNLEFPVVIKKPGPVTHVEFSPAKPHNFMVTSSVTVTVNKSSQPYSELTSLRGFKEIAYCGSFRQDGELIVAGGGEAQIQVFKDKKPLRKFVGHTGAVHLSKFTSSNFHIFSGSDDKTVRVWDLATQSQVNCYIENQDYIRCGAASLSSKDIIVAGSYDGTVKLFDLRTENSVLTLDHKDPVESVLIHPAGGIVISAGGNCVKVWDCMAGGRLLSSFSNHHKTITSLCYCSGYRRLVSASLDRHVKFYDVTNYKVVHGLEYPSAILSLAVAPDDSLITVGMSDGLLSIRRRKDEAEVEADVEKKRKCKRKSKLTSTFTVKSYTPDEDAVLHRHEKRERLAKYDVYFKRFEYNKAFDAAMSIRLRRRSPEITIAVIEELSRRHALRSCIAARDDASVADILKFLCKNYCTREFRETIVQVIDIVYDLYADKIAFMHLSCEELSKLQQVADKTVKFESEMIEIASSLTAIVSAAEIKLDDPLNQSMDINESDSMRDIRDQLV